MTQLEDAFVNQNMLDRGVTSALWDTILTLTAKHAPVTLGAQWIIPVVRLVTASVTPTMLAQRATSALAASTATLAVQPASVPLMAPCIARATR